MKILKIRKTGEKKTIDVEQICPWEMEGKKRTRLRSMPQMGSLPKRRAVTAGVRARPRPEGQEYMDIYLMYRKKDQLEKLGTVMTNKLTETAVRWRDMTKDIRTARRDLRAKIGLDLDLAEDRPKTATEPAGTSTSED